MKILVATQKPFAKAAVDGIGLMKKAVKSLKRLATMKLAKDATDNLMSSAELDKILKEGVEEIAKGNLKSVAIEDLWK